MTRHTWKKEDKALLLSEAYDAQLKGLTRGKQVEEIRKKLQSRGTIVSANSIKSKLQQLLREGAHLEQYPELIVHRTFGWSEESEKRLIDAVNHQINSPNGMCFPFYNKFWEKISQDLEEEFEHKLSVNALMNRYTLLKEKGLCADLPPLYMMPMPSSRQEQQPEQQPAARGHARWSKQQEMVFETEASRAPSVVISNADLENITSNLEKQESHLSAIAASLSSIATSMKYLIKKMTE